nr:hypothetical protein [Tanacetum cinerariifolium]
MAFVSSPSTNSTNDVYTTYEVSTASTSSSTASTKVSIASSQTSTANLSDVTVGPRNQDSRNKYQDSSRRIVPVEETPPKSMVAIDEPQFKRYGPNSCEKESKNASKDIPNEPKEYHDASLVKDRVSDNKYCSVESPVVVEKKTNVPIIAKVEVVRPKQQEKPVSIARPRPVNTARPNLAIVNAIRGHPQKEDQSYVDSGCSRHMTGNVSYLSGFKEFDGGYVTFRGELMVAELLIKELLKLISGDAGKKHDEVSYWLQKTVSQLAILEVKRTASSISSSLNMAFVSSPSTNSTNDVYTTYEVSTASTSSSTASTKVSIASSQTSTANLSDVTVYVFLANQSNSKDILNEPKEYHDASLVKDRVSDNKYCSVESPVVGHPQKEDQGYVDSGCSRHMTGNMSYLSDFKEFDGGYVTFRGELMVAELLIKELLKLVQTMMILQISGDARKKHDEVSYCSNSVKVLSVICQKLKIKFSITILDKENGASNELNSAFENLNTEYPDDPKMPGLDTIATNDNSEEVVYFTNLESSIQVSPTRTTRIHKDHPLKQPETYSYALCGNDHHYGSDCLPRLSLQDLNLKLNSDEHMNELFKDMQSMFEEYRQREQAANLITHTPEPS